MIWFFVYLKSFQRLAVSHKPPIEVISNLIRKINVNPSTETSEILFFDSIDISELPNPRIVPLYGANGSGKTTLLKELHFALYCMDEKPVADNAFGSLIEKSLARQHAGVEHDPQITIECDKVHTKYFKYRNGQDNFRVMQPRSYSESFDPYYISRKYDAQGLSEGQSIIYSVEDLLKGMLRSTKRTESWVDDSTHAILLLDEIDSGLSIDNVDRLMKIIKRVVKQGRPIQFFISFNNPWILRYFPDVISMYDGKHHHFENADEMLEDLMANQPMLDKARKSRGRYKIF